jgi:DNA-binding transcriptional MocR family regulator
VSIHSTRPASLCLPVPSTSGYSIIPNRLAELDLDASEFRVVCVLLSHRWRATSEMIPSVERIAGLAHLTERTVQRVVQRLEAKGYLVVEERFRDDGGQTSNRYTLAGDLAAIVSETDAARDGGRVTASTPARVTAPAWEPNRPRNTTKRIGQTGAGYDVAAYLAHEQATYREASKRYGVRR